MPRIRRYYPASHTLNRDPEFITLRRRYADWMGYVWHEMLAWGDHTEGELKGDIAEIALTLAAVSLQIYPRRAAHVIEKAFTYMQECEWIRIESRRIVILNHAKFHNSKEEEKTPDRNSKNPLLTTEQPTNLSNKTNTSYEEVFSESQKTSASPNGSATPSEPTTQGAEKERTPSEATAQGPPATIPSEATAQDRSSKAPRAKQPHKEHDWPPDGLFVKSFLDRQQYLAPFFTQVDLLCLNDSVWWENLSTAVNGLSEELLDQEFALMANWLRDNARRHPTPNGLRRFVGDWLKRTYEYERKKPWLSEKRAARIVRR